MIISFTKQKTLCHLRAIWKINAGKPTVYKVRHSEVNSTIKLSDFVKKKCIFLSKGISKYTIFIYDGGGERFYLTSNEQKPTWNLLFGYIIALLVQAFEVRYILVFQKAYSCMRWKKSKLINYEGRSCWLDCGYLKDVGRIFCRLVKKVRFWIAPVDVVRWYSGPMLD